MIKKKLYHYQTFYKLPELILDLYMKHFSIYKKMMIGFGAVIALMIISSGYVLFELNRVAANSEKIIAANVKTQEIARTLLALIQDENSYIEKYTVSEDTTYSSLFFETSDQVAKGLGELVARLYSEDQKSLVDTMENAHDQLIKSMTEVPESKQQIETVREKNVGAISRCLGLLIKQNRTDIISKMEQIEKITQRSVRISFFIIAATLIAAVTGAFLITRTITAPIEKLIDGTRQISKGNFEAIQIDTGDDIAQLASAMNEMSRKIDETNKQRTRMMQQISHEIKTPLQAMQSAHDILKHSGAVDNEKAHLLETFRRSIEKISGFSKQYLDLAKIESGAMQYDLEWTQLDDIIHPIVEDAKIIAASKNIRLEFEKTSLPEIQIDREKIHIVISNLINNAIKYTHENGQVCITLTKNGKGVQIDVADTGIGIEKEEIGNVFIRFYQAKNIEKIKSEGSGVGLAIVRAYTEGHGGHVDVKSRPDEGSTFSIYLPVKNNTKDEDESHLLLS